MEACNTLTITIVVIIINKAQKKRVIINTIKFTYQCDNEVIAIFPGDVFVLNYL